MPSLGADMQEGTLIEWSVKPGDRVKRGDIIGVVRTEKADIEVEVYHDGVVDQLLAKAGETLPVGAVLAVIREEGESAVAGHDEIPTPSGRADVGRVRASPLARRVAQELGVDLAHVQGTGPHGEITKQDVQRATEALKKAPIEQPVAPDFRAGMRRAIAAAMARSNREIPHYYLETRIDMQRALKFLEAENQKRSVKDRLLSVILLIKAVARALHDVPELNAYWVDDQLQRKEAVHIGFAISLREGGLVVPAILDADRKNLDELMQALRDLITRARSRPAAKFRNYRRDGYDHELGRSGSGDGPRRNLSASGGASWLRQDHRIAVGGEWNARNPDRCDSHAGGRPSRDRWPSRRTVPHRAESASARAREAMREAEIGNEVSKVLRKIAPEANLDQLNPEENLREALDIDSFDFLNLMIGLHDELKVEIPESDYRNSTHWAS